MKKILWVALVAGLAAISLAQNSALRVEMSGVKSNDDLGRRMDLAARKFAMATARLTENARTIRHHTSAYGYYIPFSMPTRMLLTKDGQVLPGLRRPNGGPTALTLAFDAQGLPRAFPPGYQTQLQTAFDTAVSTINVVFGPPSAAGTVFVRNYDADIGDRDAVAGGYFTPNNGSGQAEIRFPVYQNAEAAYVNFVHTILLAYLGADNYAWDGFEEGVVRAAVMKIVRTPGALPVGLDPLQVEAVLESTYDVGPFYDWYNQRALGGPVFIAPNLRDVQLPPGGSTGGLYLLRYQMAGSAWAKMLVEYPGFIAQLNASLYASPSLGSDIVGLANQCQTIMNTLAGGGGATVEGLSFSNWGLRQFILETKQTNGAKLLVEPVAISSGLSGSDFGVFNVQANYFQTLANGNETLLSGTSFPIFWDSDFSRVFPTAQENQMDIAGGFGSVTPNFPDLFAGQPYRMTVDLPVLDSNARTFLPAGAIATATNPVANTFFGTVENVPLQPGDTLNVLVSWPASAVPPIAVTNGAFGTLIADSTFDVARRVTIQVVLTHNAVPSTVMTRVVDKSPGPLAVDLRVNGEGTYAFAGGLPAGISMVGFPIDPFESYAPDIFNVSAGSLLLARYNQTRTQYDLFPDTEAPTIGHGYFVRLNAAQAGFSVDGRVNPNTPSSVALKPGWNMITSPLPEQVPTTSIKVIRSTAIPTNFAISAGTDIGLDFFQFIPGANDPSSGVPETGSLIPALVFQPGVSYFVRALAPEGVSMLFFPSNPQIPPFIAHEAAKPRNDGWQVRFDLQSTDRMVSAYIGTAKGATNGFDPKLDSAMPPGIGGFQLTVTDSQPLFRDIRSVTSNQSYTLRMDGLVRGTTYSLMPNVERGKINKYLVVPDRGDRANLAITKPYRFTATGSRQTVKITVKVVD